MVPNPDTDLFPPPSQIAMAKIWIGAHMFDADPKLGIYTWSDKKNELYSVYERQYLTYLPASYPRTLTFGEKAKVPWPPEDQIVVSQGPVIDPYLTLAEISAVSCALSRWIDLGTVIRRPSLGGLPVPVFGSFRGTDPLTGIVLTENGYVKDYFKTGADANDVEISAPMLNMKHYIPEENEVRVEFQGAYPAVAGLSAPGNDRSEWTSDLSSLSGYPFIRFRVLLNVAKEGQLKINSYRPQVNFIRLRATY